MSEPTEWPPREIAAFRAAVLRYFAEERRLVPWRENADPYRVLVSEFMLQQTRTETVVPYFRAWTAAFPDVDRLAAADPQEVLKAWEGLGYYRRAHNLHSTAREIVARYGGRVPQDLDALRTLPGVGEYTAGAVASIAFGIPAPAIDGNVRRVMARIADDPAPTPTTLREWTGALVDPDDPGAFNQGLMEIGSRVCLPRSPRCDECPVRRWCSAERAGTQNDRPRRKRRPPVPHWFRAVAVLVERDGPGGRASVFLTRRPDRGLLAGMWELPSERIESDGGARAAAGSVATRVLAGDMELESEPLSPVSHTFSHRKVTYHPFLFEVRGLRAGEADAETPPTTRGRGGRWTDLDALDELPVPVAQRKMLAVVVARFV